MKATKIIGIVLIAFSIYLGYVGINKVSNNTNEVTFLGLDIDASNESGQQRGYIFLGIAVLLFVGGVYSLKSDK